MTYTDRLGLSSARPLCKSLLLVGLCLTSSRVAAQDTATRDAVRWSDHRDVADKVSTVAVITALGTPCLLERTWNCAKHEGVRVGVALGIAELTKRLVHRTRPDGSDDKSFFSEHTALTCAATIRTKLWALCPAVGYLRMGADKHWLSDVGTGAGVGALLTVAW